MRNAPNAGEWFHDQFVMLMQNSMPPLAEAPSYEPRVAPPQLAEPAAAPPPPIALATKEGNFAFSYDNAAEIAADTEATGQQPVKLGARNGPSAVLDGILTKQTGPRFTWHAPPPPSPAASLPVSAPLPPLSGARVMRLAKVAAIAVAAATLVTLIWNAVSPARRKPEQAPSRSRRSRRLCSNRVDAHHDSL